MERKDRTSLLPSLQTLLSFIHLVVEGILAHQFKNPVLGTERRGKEEIDSSIGFLFICHFKLKFSLQKGWLCFSDFWSFLLSHEIPFLSPHRIKGCQGFSQLIWETMRLRPSTSRSIDMSISLFSLIFSNVEAFLISLPSQMSERENSLRLRFMMLPFLSSLKDRTFLPSDTFTIEG